MLGLMLILAASTGPVDPRTGVPEWEKIARHCVYYNRKDENSFQGACEEYNNYKTGEHSILMPGRKFAIKDYEPMQHELPWMWLTINGQPAIGYERHRSWISYADAGHQFVLDVCGEADQFGGCQ